MINNNFRRWRTIVLLFLFLVMITFTILSTSNQQIPAALLGGQEQPSPTDWVSEKQIKVYPDRVILDVPHALWAGFTNTNSMDPLLDEQSNALEIKPDSGEQIQVGDVIAYKTNLGVIIHRVIEKNLDSEGIYYTVKGDNSTFADPVKVRFADVQGVVVAVIY